jgi:hypothetical protein
MHAGRSQRSRLIPSGWRLARLLVLCAFALSVLDLPLHLVHHLGEVDPACQLLGLSVALNTSILADGWVLSVDCTWDEIVIPCMLPSVSLPVAAPQARSPPAIT